MDKKLNIPVIVGTTRPNRQSIKPANYIVEVGKKHFEHNIFLVDPNEFNLPGDGNGPESRDPEYSKIVAEADAFVIVTPEYNHSFPGSLKRLLDNELENYNKKPVTFAGVSAGPWGGIRAIEALVVAVREMGLIASAYDLMFPNVFKLFDENGDITDDSYEDRIKKAFDELIWLAMTLKRGRENV